MAAVDIQYPADPETQIFVNRLSAVFRAAGWTVTEQGVMSFGPVIGLAIQMKDTDIPPAGAAVLREALMMLAAVRTRAEKQMDSTEELVLVVGSKPAE